MSAALICPGCGFAKTKRATLCASCRRRAIAAGVEQILEPPPADPRSPSQNSAFHGKASTLALLFCGQGSPRPEIARKAIDFKHEALAFASDRFGRKIESSRQLSRDEMSEVLDWLDGQVETLDEGR